MWLCHFHEIDGRSLFFFPAELPHRDGHWIFVEFAVAGSDVPCLARGRVRTQQGANLVGSWLEFPIAGLPAIIKDLGTTRRAQERLPVDVTGERVLRGRSQAGVPDCGCERRRPAPVRASVLLERR